jgi:SAM-dependent methyltransferase
VGEGTSRAIDPAYLAYQYGDAEKLRVRFETHERYSERPNHEFFDWVIEQLDPQPGEVVADVGCGPGGTYQPRIATRGSRIVSVDRSPGMLHEARGVAVVQGFAGRHVLADAQALPLRDASCDRLLAAQMLYHVPDREAALREMRRVLRPGGRVLLVTGSWATPRYMQLHAEAVAELGYTNGDAGGARFTLHDIALVQTTFPQAEVRTFENALVFPDVESVLRFYASGPVDGIAENTASGAHRAPLMAAMERRLRPIFEAEGALREPKIYGCFIADV